MKLAFLYAGQGSQKAGMGKDMYVSNSIFKESIDRCDEEYKKQNTGIGLKELMFEAPLEKLSQTRYTQVAMGAFAVAMTNVLFEKNIRPEAVAGLSLGEYSALYAAGVFKESEIIDLLSCRGAYMEEAAKGVNAKMSAVLGLGREPIKEAVRQAAAIGKVEISNYNSTGQTVIGGEEPAVEEAKKLCLQAGAKKCMDLNVSGPFHTSYMEGAAEKLAEKFTHISFGREQIPVIYNTIARERLGENITDLLVRQVKSSVYMEDTILYLEQKGFDSVIEIGPGKVLSGFVRRTAGGIKTYAVDSEQSLMKLLEEMS